MEACLHLSEFPEHPVAPHDVDLFHTVATVKVPEQASFGFAAPDADIDFVPELDHYNFRELTHGELLGRVRPGSPARLQALDENGEDIGDRLFDYRQGRDHAQAAADAGHADARRTGDPPGLPVLPDGADRHALVRMTQPRG